MIASGILLKQEIRSLDPNAGHASAVEDAGLYLMVYDGCAFTSGHVVADMLSAPLVRYCRI